MIKSHCPLVFSSLLIGLMTIAHPAYAEDWQYVTTQQDGTMTYYDADSIRLADIDNSDDKGFIVVTKEKLSPTAAKDTMKLIIRIQPHVNDLVSYDITPVQFNLKKQCRPLGIYYYGDGGSLLLKVPVPQVNKWHDLTIDNSLYTVYNIVVKRIAENTDYYMSQRWYSTTEKKFYDPPGK